MLKNSEKDAVVSAKKVKKILIAQHKPEGLKSPYFDFEILYSSGSKPRAPTLL